MDRFTALHILAPLEEADLRRFGSALIVVFLSGFTASGKDSILQRAMDHPAGRALQIRPVIKLSDRPSRRIEAPTFRRVPRGHYDMLLAERDILFPYQWFGHRYGFERDDFVAKGADGGVVVFLMTAPNLVPKAAAAFQAVGIKTIAVFVHAQWHELVARTWARGISPRDALRRTFATAIEVSQVASRTAFTHEYISIWNSDGRLSDAVETFVNLLTRHHTSTTSQVGDA